jgi:Zn-dependent protease
MMRTRRRFQLARVFGIPISVGISWFLMLFFYIFAFTPYFHEVLGGSYSTAYEVAVASGLSLFLSLILHELGHALVARRNGLDVIGIELWALGGVTRTSDAAQSPGAQFRIAAAGPLVTLVVIVVSIVAGEALVADRHFFDVAVGNAVHSTPVVVCLSWVATLNVLVLVLNLIPAFPLDGGQIAYAFVWWRTGDRNIGTRVTGRMGQGFAVLLGIGSLVLFSEGDPNAIFIIVIALFIYQGAGAAVAQGALGQRMERLTVADVMDRDPVTIPAELTLLDARDQFFVPYRWHWFAVVDPAQHFLGVLRQDRLDAEISAGRPALFVTDLLDDDTSMRIDEDQPLESLLRSRTDALARLGGVVAVDGEGILRGVVTLAQVRKALRMASGA